MITAIFRLRFKSHVTCIIYANIYLNNVVCGINFSLIPIDAKYEQMLIKLQEAIEDGRADGDCQAKYKCSESASTEDNLDLI